MSRLNLVALRRYLDAVSKERDITLVPARGWSYSIYEATIVYPLDALRAWYREPGEVIYDVGPEPADNDVAMRRIESIIDRLIMLIEEEPPEQMDKLERAIVKLQAKHRVPAASIASLFWHLEHGRVENKLRVDAPNYVRLGGFPAFGEDYRAYALGDLSFYEQCYGILANPSATLHDPYLVTALTPLQNAPTRAALFAAFQRHFGALASLIPPRSANVPGGATSIATPVIFIPGGTGGGSGGGLLGHTADDEDDDYTVEDAVEEDEAPAPTPEQPAEQDDAESQDEDETADEEADEEEGVHAGPYELAGEDAGKGCALGSPIQKAFYADPDQIDASFYLSLTRPTIKRFLDAMSVIAGKARCERRVLTGQRDGMLDPRRLAAFAATKDMNIFRKPFYIQKQGRLSVAFLIDDSGSMGSLSAARFPGAINVAYPRLTDIQMARFLALGLAESVHQIGGRAWISTINHYAIDEWQPGIQGHKRALGRIVATGTSAPDESLSAILAQINDLPAPRLICFITDGEVGYTNGLVNTRTTRLISVVPPTYQGEQLYGSPTLKMDEGFFEAFTRILRESTTQLAARS